MMRHLRELTRAASLLLMGIILLDTLGQALAIGDLRRADVGIDLIGALKNIDLDVEMQFAHALQNGLAGFLIRRDAEGRILGGELRQRNAKLLLIGLRLRLDGDLDDRLGKFHPLENHGLLLIAQRVASARILEAGKRDDVAGISLFDVFAVVGVHQQHTADTLALVLGRIEHRGARIDLAGIDAGEGQRPDKRIVHDLEGKHRERLVVTSDTDGFFAGIHVDALDRFAIERRRQIIDNGVEQRLHALVLEGRAAEHRNKGDMANGFADEPFQRRLVRLGAVEISAHHIVIELDSRFDQIVAIFFRLLFQTRPECLRHGIWRRAPRLPRRRLSSVRDR